jgi:hypothetical protein
MDITELLKTATQDILTEETLKEIESAFNTSVEDKVKIHVEKALAEQDSDYAEKLKSLLEVVDKDHTQKLIRVVEAIDNNHSHKLKLLVSKFNKELNHNANAFKDSIINNISTYLEAYLDEAIPAEKINEAVKSKRASMVLEQIKEILGVDTAVASKAIKTAVIDGKRQIDEANTKLEAAQKELQQLKEEYSSTKSELVLEKKLTKVDGKKKEYLKKMMKGKSPEFIQENFDYASKLFDTSKSEHLKIIKDEAVESSKSQQVDRPVVEDEVTIVESVYEEKDTQMNPYLRELSKF